MWLYEIGMPKNLFLKIILQITMSVYYDTKSSEMPAIIKIEQAVN